MVVMWPDFTLLACISSHMWPALVRAYYRLKARYNRGYWQQLLREKRHEGKSYRSALMCTPDVAADFCRRAVSASLDDWITEATLLHNKLIKTLADFCKNGERADVEQVYSELARLRIEIQHSEFVLSAQRDILRL